VPSGSGEVDGARHYSTAHDAVSDAVERCQARQPHHCARHIVGQQPSMSRRTEPSASTRATSTASSPSFIASRDAGNTLLVVSNMTLTSSAPTDRILDMGPGPGERGGNRLLGTQSELKKCKRSLTAKYLTSKERRIAGHLCIRQAIAKIGVRPSTNLKSVNIEIPLNRLVCITGVSGSGKSSLIEDVLLSRLYCA